MDCSRPGIRLRAGLAGGIVVALMLLMPMTLVPAAGARDAGVNLVFGVVPQHPPKKIVRLWGPLLDHLSAKTGYRLRLAAAPDIPTFERRVADGEYDIAYMNPYHYVLWREIPGYRVFAKEKDRYLRGIIVVGADSPYRDASELRGETLAFPSKNAFGASVLTRAYLRDRGIVFSAKYVGSHDSVYKAVARGLYPAGGGVLRTLGAASPAVGRQLRVLWVGPPFVAHAIAAHPGVSPEVLARLRQAMVDVDGMPGGSALLAELGFEGFTPAQDREFAPLTEFLR